MLGAGDRRDAGETLLEILLAIAIMAVCFGAVLAGIATSARTSGIHHDSVFAENYARNIAELVQSQAFTACTSSYATAGVLPAGSSFTVPAPTILYWDKSTRIFSGTCPGAGTDELQQVTIKVVPPDMRAATSQILVLKRKV